MNRYWIKFLRFFYLIVDLCNPTIYFKIWKNEDVLISDDIILWVPLRRYKRAIRHQKRQCNGANLYYKIKYFNRMFYFKQTPDYFIMIVDGKILYFLYYDIGIFHEKFLSYKKYRVLLKDCFIEQYDFKRNGLIFHGYNIVEDDNFKFSKKEQVKWFWKGKELC